VGFVVGKVALGQVFSEYFGFPCQFSFHQLLHTHHHLSSGAGTVGQWWLTYQVDSVSPHLKKLKYIHIYSTEYYGVFLGRFSVLFNDDFSTHRLHSVEFWHVVVLGTSLPLFYDAFSTALVI
jgi:hypothetical protein